MFFIHLICWWKFNCIRILAIVNNVTRNNRVHISFQVNSFISFRSTHKVELLDHMIVPFFNFWGTSTLFSVVVAPIYFSTDSALYSLFTVSSLVYLLSFFYLFYWGIVDLQCVSFRCTAKSVNCTYISILFQFIFPCRLL